MFGRTILKWIMLASNIVAAFFMLITLLGTVVSPEKFMLPAYFGLLYPFVIVLNFGFVIAWLLVRNWYFLISLSLLFLSASQIADIFPVHIGESIEMYSEKSFTLLTYNTMGTGQLKKHTKKRPNKVIQYILDQNTDIVCLQEFAVSDNDEYVTKTDIEKIFSNYPYKYIRLKTTYGSRHNGIATFSKFPIINKQNIAFDAAFNSSIYTDIKIGMDTVRVINNHLESNRITENDKAMPLLLKDNFDAENLSGITKHFSRKLGIAYKQRAMQADSVANIIARSPYKLIVCGDFNDVPATYTYTKVKGKLKDAFSETGNGFGWTFEDRFYHFRIDYILYDSDYFFVTKYKSHKVKYSDHYPVKCKINFKTNNE